MGSSITADIKGTTVDSEEFWCGKLKAVKCEGAGQNREVNWQVGMGPQLLGWHVSDSVERMAVD